MADIIQPQLIVTEFVVKGEEDIKRMKGLQDSLDKKTTINVDTSKAQKGIIDLGKSIEQVNSKQFAALKNSFKDIERQAAFKNIDKSKIAAFTKEIEKSSNEVDVLRKSVAFFKENLDKLNLKPKELAEFNQRIADSESFIEGFGKEIEKTGQKSQSLRGQLARVKNELTLLDQAGQGSTDMYRQLQLEAAKLEDEIADNRAAVKALASDTLKLDAGIGAVRGLVAGFTAYQGILGLVGVENKEFEKTLLKINGAMAVLQGLQEITNLLQKESAFRLVATSIAQNVWNTSLSVSNGLLRVFGIQAAASAGAVRALQIALAASGIGLAIAAIGALVALNIKLYNTYLDLKNGSKALTEAEDKAAEVLIKRLELEEENQKVLKGGINDRQREIDILKAKGASLDLINSKENALYAEQIRNNEKRIAELSKSELSYSGVARAELRKRSDENRAFIAEQRALNEAYKQERIAAALDLREKEAQIDLNTTGLFGNELQKRIELANIAYQKDLLAYGGTEQEKRKFKKLSDAQLAQDIEKIRRQIESRPFDPLTTTTQLNAGQRALLQKQAAGIAADFVDNIEGSLKKPLAPSVRAAYEKLLTDIFLGENVDVDSAFKKDLENIFKNLPKVIEEKSKDAKAKTPPVSLGELIFGNVSDAEKENAKYFDLFLSQSLAFFAAQTQAQIDADNRAIQSQEAKINRFRELAEFGTAEQLQLEEQRLTELQRKREEDVQKQRQLAAIQIAINNAVTASETIKAIAKAFGEGNILTGILTSAALLATIASTVSSVSSAFSSLPAFEKGSDRLRRGNIDKKGGSLAIVHPDEAILKPSHNKAMDYAPNHKKVEMYQLGRSIADGTYKPLPSFANSIPSGGYISEDREIKPLLKEVLKELRGNKTRVVANMNLDKKGFVSIVTEEILKKERKEKSR